MHITELIKHPERLDKETLYDLRSLVALYPYYQPARLLMLQNLYLLHSPQFDEELKRAAIYITNRRVVFNMVEALHYQIQPEEKSASTPKNEAKNESRTISLIDDFLDSLPEEEESAKKPQRKPTPADAAIDYVSYLLESETEAAHLPAVAPQLKGQFLIDHFIFNEGGKMQLKEEPEFTPNVEEKATEISETSGEGYFTETLAKIYIRQGRYEKALEIIRRLNLNYPKKNAYFADQIRFLEKLIINNQTNK